ncbi:ankyrin repeat domain-containing protein 16-like [Haliotis rubra]|uniref:ankyrin repeat domain-containing protein 16-like n=1 Tax=Haliotis rubra TaxID=36100 RepID=UPI001EE571F1|nr:ankyrin repeat domain-containing protein 16-like [Haliotis rubra]
MLACTKTNPEVIRALLEKGADPALRNKDGWNSFHIAAREGRVEILQLLLHHDAQLWNTVSKNGRTPLHTAALNGCTDVVRFLVESCDYPCDMVDSCGTTPLMDALRAGHVDTAQILLNLHKADVAKEDKLGRQLVHLVSEAGQLEALDFLLDTFHMSVDTRTSTTQCTPLHVAAKEGQDAIMQCLLRRGANVHLLDTSLRSALHIASGGQHAGCVELLLQHGAGASQDKHGQTARQMAKKDDVKQVFKKYLDHVT